MAYFIGHEKVIQDGAILNWVMRGRPGRDADLTFSLCVRFIELPDGRSGVVLDQGSTHVPDEIDVTCIQSEDIALHKGQAVFLEGMNGLFVKFERDYYQLFTVVRGSVRSGIEGKLYFHTFVPAPFGNGEIVYTEAQWLE